MEKVEALGRWREAGVFSAKEKVVLAYTEAMTLTGERVNHEMILKLKEFFSDDEIVELTALIAFQNMASKFNAALDVPPQGFCRLPSTALQSGTVLPSSRAQKTGITLDEGNTGF